jgi:Sugar-transfer associated ATP-grasp
MSVETPNPNLIAENLFRSKARLVRPSMLSVGPGSRLKRLVRLLFVAYAFVKEVIAYIGLYPAHDIFFTFRHGFAADRLYLYGRRGILSGEYLTDLQRQFSRFINPKPVRELLEDKLLFAALIGHYVAVPMNYLYSSNRRCVVLCNEWETIISGRSPDDTLPLVLKRARGGGGTHISVIEMQQDIVRSGQETMSLAQFYRYFARHEEFLVCQFIKQCDFCSKIYPGTTNTLRVICMRNREGDPFVARAVLRLGSQNSNGVDNFGQGGLAVDVNLESGNLGVAVEHDTSAPREPKNHLQHPDTGTQIFEEVLPNWNVAKEASLKLMRQFPFINYVGWDIVLTDTGPVFLEGNNYTGVRLAQIHSGLLNDDQICDFYLRHGILGDRPFDQLRRRGKRH